MPMWKCCQFQIQLPMPVVAPENQATQTQETVCKPPLYLVLLCHHGDHTMSELARYCGNESRSLHNFVSNHCTKNPK